PAFALGALTLACALAAGCASQELAVPATSQAVAVKPPPNPSTPVVTPPPPAPATPSKISTAPVYIDAIAEDTASSGNGLAAAAATERARRQDAGLPSVVITDANLSKYA